MGLNCNYTGSNNNLGLESILVLSEIEKCLIVICSIAVDKKAYISIAVSSMKAVFHFR